MVSRRRGQVQDRIFSPPGYSFRRDVHARDTDRTRHVTGRMNTLPRPFGI
jgi:hypothetical protein